MEYNPKYPQPFSLSQAIALDPAVAWDEIARLKNSLQHLKRSQNELQEYLRELASEEKDLQVSQALKENEITIASQDERIFMLKLALTHHGHSASSSSGQTSDPLTSSTSTPSGSRTGGPQDTAGSSSNGLDDFPPVGRTLAVNPETSEAEEQENGVYL